MPIRGLDPSSHAARWAALGWDQFIAARAAAASSGEIRFISLISTTTRNNMPRGGADDASDASQLKTLLGAV
jgi:hypothetical protein